jgi:hypothetical protein
VREREREREREHVRERARARQSEREREKASESERESEREMALARVRQPRTAAEQRAREHLCASGLAVHHDELFATRAGGGRHPYPHTVPLFLV